MLERIIRILVVIFATWGFMGFLNLGLEGQYFYSITLPTGGFIGCCILFSVIIANDARKNEEKKSVDYPQVPKGEDQIGGRDNNPSN